ncbi:MAG: MerR family transcriptional regulator [Bacteroidota bacterium]
MEQFTVKALAKLAKISVRTLHHYDKISLLKPLLRSESGYRYYGRDELFRLQQILFYKELDFSLSSIAVILDDPGFDLLAALNEHKKEIKKRKSRLSELLLTIDKTIDELKTAQPIPNNLKNQKMKYEDLYKGFSKEQAEAYQKEAAERWGAETVAESNKKLLAMNKGEWKALKQQGEDIYKRLVQLMRLPPSDAQVQELIQQHFEMTGRYFNVTHEIYSGLGSMYLEDERFKAYYDKYDAGLAEFLRDAIHVFCKV